MALRALVGISLVPWWLIYNIGRRCHRRHKYLVWLSSFLARKELRAPFVCSSQHQSDSRALTETPLLACLCKLYHSGPIVHPYSSNRGAPVVGLLLCHLAIPVDNMVQLFQYLILACFLPYPVFNVLGQPWVPLLPKMFHLNAECIKACYINSHRVCE